MTGDRYQHGSVQRGAVLRLLEEEAGLVPAEVKEIQRQSGAYRTAVRALSEGHAAEGLRQLDSLGWVREVPNAQRCTSKSPTITWPRLTKGNRLGGVTDPRGRCPDYRRDSR